MPAKVRRCIVLAALLGLLAGCGSNAPGRVADEIRETLAAYQTALRERNGRAAAELVNGATHGYYQRVRELALYGTPVQVQALPITDQIQVLLVRSRMDAQALKEMDGGKLFRHFVDKGWSGGGASLQRVRLGEFAIEGDVATAAQMDGDKPSILRWRFVREEHRWRVDLTALLPVAERAMRQALQRTPLTQDEFLLKAIESRSLMPVTDRIWQPMSPRLN